eukprot:jgi/Picre1/32336/NNA_007682.t1
MIEEYVDAIEQLTCATHAKEHDVPREELLRLSGHVLSIQKRIEQEIGDREPSVRELFRSAIRRRSMQPQKSELDKTISRSSSPISQYALVEFYANWCGYCQEFAPIYEEAARRLAELNTSILVGKVDAPENEDLADQYEIDGLPTVRWFVNGKDEHEYSGSHNM